MSVASDSKANVTVSKNYSKGDAYIGDHDTTSAYVNTKSTAGNVAVNYTNAAEDDLNSSIDVLKNSAETTQGGITDFYSLLGGEDLTKNVQGYTGRMVSDAESARTSAANMSEDIDAIRALSGSINQNGVDLTNRGREYLQAGSQILNMDASATGLAGEFLTALRAIDPDKYVASAAADVQSSYAGTYQQMLRQLSRTGASGSSGNAIAAKQQWARALATAKAAAKTKATQTGNSERLSALSEAIKTAASASEEGKSLTDSGTAALSTAADKRSAAVDALGKQASAYATAAGIEKSAAEVEESAVSARASALQAATAAQSEVNSAAKTYAEGLQSRASYYTEQAKSWGEIAGETNLVNALFSDKVSDVQSYVQENGANGMTSVPGSTVTSLYGGSGYGVGGGWQEYYNATMNV